MTKYKVNNTGFDSYMKATAFAAEENADVVEVATGIVRWTPAPAPTAKQINMYRHRKAAYEAQERLNRR